MRIPRLSIKVATGILLLVGMIGVAFWARRSGQSALSVPTAIVTSEPLPLKPVEAPAAKPLTQGVQTPPPAPVTVKVSLDTRLKQWVDAHKGTYGITVRELTGPKRSGHYQADKQIVAASTYKLFLVYAVLHEVEQGRLSLQATLKDGSDLTACIDSLLVRSSDVCAWEMGNLVGWPRISDFLYAQGFKGTAINNYDAAGNFTDKDKLTTANDLAELLTKLENGQLLNSTHRDVMLSRMKRQIWRERIPAGVSAGVVVADKPGWIYAIQNDAAIVYAKDRTYVLVILSDGSSAANLADLSKVVYDYLQ